MAGRREPECRARRTLAFFLPVSLRKDTVANTLLKTAGISRLRGGFRPRLTPTLTEARRQI